MKFQKKKYGVSILCLLLIFTTSISLIDFEQKNNVADENSLLLSAPEDNYEPNNNFIDAYNLSIYKGRWLTEINGPGAQWDDDYYRINIAPGHERLVVFLLFNHGDGDIDIEVIQNGTFSVMVGAYSSTDNEYIDYILPYGLYFLRVYYSDYGNGYDLLWDSLNPGAPDDLYEENDSPSLAYVLGNKTWLGATGNGLGIHKDDDYYEIQITPGYERLKVDLIYSQVAGQMGIEILNSSYIVVASSYTTEDNEFMNVVLPSGIYYIRIHIGYYGGFYNLRWENGPTGDVYEQNDFDWEAFNLEPWDGSWLPFGPASQEDDDWYEVYLDPGEERIYVELAFFHAEGNIDMEIWYWDGIFTKLAGSYSFDDNEFIDVNAPWSGYYYIIVYGYDAGNQYNLFWEDKTPIASEDMYEENDDWMTAYDISGNEYMSHMGILLDDDWYKVYVDSGEERLRVDVYYTFIPGHDIDFEIYYYNGIDLDFIAWTNDTTIDTNLPTYGWYYIYIYGDNAGNQYDLYWEDLMPYDDAYEENDYDWEAYYLSPFAASWLPFGLGIQFDEDWYEVYLDPGEERLFVELTFTHSEGDIDVEVWYWDAGYFTLIGGSYSFDDYESIDIITPYSGNYYIKVYGDNMGNYYDLWWEDLDPGGGGGMDDMYEDNDDFWNATWISPNYYPDLRIINYDEDWFSIYLNYGDIIDVDIYFNHWEGDLELELYDPYYSHRIGSYSSDDGESISFTADDSGEWRIRVYHAIGDTRVNYNLDIWLSGRGDDAYEENDFAFEAFDLTMNEGWDLYDLFGEGKQFDIDWYKFDIGSESDYLMVELHFNNWEGNIDLELYDSNSNMIAWSYSGDDNEHVDIEHPEEGTYYARVFGDNNGNWYNLFWSSGGQGQGYGDDCYEKNDYPDFDVEMETWYNVYDLGDYERTWLSDICGLAVQGNDDWYMIDVTPGFSQLVVELKFNHSMGDIEIEVYGEWNMMSPTTGNYSTTDDEYIHYHISQPGLYFLRIYGSDMSNEYDLWWDDLRTDFRTDDRYEFNNNATTAYDLIMYEDYELDDLSGFGLQFNHDWYEIFVTPERLLLFIEVEYDSAEGLMGFDVYDDSLHKVTGNFTFEDDDFILYRLRSNGTYYIKVYGDDTGNVYNLMWKTKEDIPFEEIPGYDILVLIGSILGVTTILVTKWKRSKLNQE